MSTKKQIKVKKSQLSMSVSIGDTVLWYTAWHKVVGDGGLPWARYWLLEEDIPENVAAIGARGKASEPSSVYATAYAQQQKSNRDDDDDVVAGVVAGGIAAAAAQETEEPVRYPQAQELAPVESSEPARYESTILENPDPTPSYAPDPTPDPTPSYESPSVDSSPSFDPGPSTSDSVC